MRADGEEGDEGEGEKNGEGKEKWLAEGTRQRSNEKVNAGK